MKKISVLATVGLGAAAALLGACPAHAGVVDGSANNLLAANQANVLGALVNSALAGNDNNNANTAAFGMKNNAYDN